MIFELLIYRFSGEFTNNWWSHSMNLHVISVFYVSIFRKGKKVIRKETFKKKNFLSTSTDISSVYFKKSDLDLKATSEPQWTIYDGVEFLIYYANIYKYAELVMNGKNKHGLILS